MQRRVEPLDDVAHRPAQRLGAVDDDQAGDVRLPPALDQVDQQRLDHGSVLRRSHGQRQHVLFASRVDADRRHQDVTADVQPVDLDHQQVEPRQVAGQPLFQLRRAQRHEAPRDRDFVVARLAWSAKSPSGSRTERAYLRVATPIII